MRPPDRVGPGVRGSGARARARPGLLWDWVCRALAGRSHPPAAPRTGGSLRHWRSGALRRPLVFIGSAAKCADRHPQPPIYPSAKGVHVREGLIRWICTHSLYPDFKLSVLHGVLQARKSKDSLTRITATRDATGEEQISTKNGPVISHLNTIVSPNSHPHPDSLEVCYFFASRR